MRADSTFYQVVVVLHVLAAIVWVGGLLFIPTVAVPTSRRYSEDRRRELMDAIGRQFRPVGWSALAVSVTTGAYMLYHWGATWSSLLSLSFVESPHARPLGFKLALVAAMLVVSGLHDWWVGPRASATDDPYEASYLRTQAKWLGRLAALLAVGVVLIAVFVARPWF